MNAANTPRVRSTAAPSAQKVINADAPQCVACDVERVKERDAEDDGGDERSGF
jgi:hypothetical protein